MVDSCHAPSAEDYICQALPYALKGVDTDEVRPLMLAWALVRHLFCLQQLDGHRFRMDFRQNAYDFERDLRWVAY